ncbi:8564_t:CDS:2 [Ambispora leptoticha]|uniref:8564_t:CDS:1 n=1 Tax=Ambispora leptoticha TaxID=144679 RepID=A0A9N9D6F1_9GLOM|nr:8564_t:CDS:2 [Ambispora leptoticha]
MKEVFFSLGIPVDNPAYFTFDHECLRAILTWGQAPEAATLRTKKEEKKSQSIAKFWENVASVEDQRMAAIARRRVVVV